MFVQLHSLITKFLGETAAKLHLVFDAYVGHTGRLLVDEFECYRGRALHITNDVGEIRRVLNSFLQFMERDDSDSIVIAATNLVEMLDPALFRRFDDVITYRLAHCGDGGAVDLEPAECIRYFLSQLDTCRQGRSRLGVTQIISRACDDAAKAAVLEGTLLRVTTWVLLDCHAACSALVTRRSQTEEENS